MKAVKKGYNEGGKITGSKGRKVISERDMDKIQRNPRSNAEYKGQDYLEQNVSDIPDAQLLKYFRVQQASKSLPKGFSVGAGPDKILSMARKKGVYQDASAKARKLFEAEMAKRKLK